MAVANGAQASDLLTVDTAHHFLNAVRAAGIRGDFVFLLVLVLVETCKRLAEIRSCMVVIILFFTVPALPPWVVDTTTMEIFRDAFSKKIPPKKLNSRGDTELFLLNIEGRLLRFYFYFCDRIHNETFLT